MEEIFFKIISAVIAFITGTDIEMKGIMISQNDGLYKDTTESGRYVYKGVSPNNYLLFNNELWRIMSFEKDGTVKIIKNEVLLNKAFDENNKNDWTSSSLNSYLNNDYYNSLSKEAQKLIVPHYFNIGFNFENSEKNLSVLKKQEEKNKAISKVGLMTISDYLFASSSGCNNLASVFGDNRDCYKSNYISLINHKNYMWTITKDYGTKNIVITTGNMYFGDSEAYFENIGVVPVLYLKKDIKLTGKGKKEIPFEIK